MPAPLRFLTAPLRLTGRLRLGQLVTLVATDALVRRARAGDAGVQWECATMAGDLAGQHEVDRELGREGQDRGTLVREAFVERVRACEAAARTRVGGLLQMLGVDVDLEAGALDQPEAARAARTAFVRLYEEGLLSLSEQVVDTCPHCLTVVDRADAETTEIASEKLLLRLDRFDGGIDGGAEPLVDLVTYAPELIAAAVAVAVPPGHAAAGRRVELPLAGIAVPVVPTDTDMPFLVVPAHDRVSWEIARRHGLAPVHLLDLEGVAHHAGPLDGLGRYAARTAARDMLAAEGVVVEAWAAAEEVARCRRCRTVLIARLGHHWTLPTASLEVAAADAVREGRVTFLPPSAREEFLARAGQGGDWCVSYQVVAGQPVPAATCLDCGRPSVSVDPLDDCPRCMGELRPDGGVLDARFVGAVWPLAAAGWPAMRAAALDPSGTTLVLGPGGLTTWALSMAALGLQLAGVVPFARVIVHPVSATEDDPDPMIDDPEDVVRAAGALLVRIALLAGGLDLDQAADVVAALEAGPRTGQDDIASATTAVETAFAAGRPGDALAAVVAAAGSDGLATLAAPMLGEVL